MSFHASWIVNWELLELLESGCYLFLDQVRESDGSEARLGE